MKATHFTSFTYFYAKNIRDGFVAQKCEREFTATHLQARELQSKTTFVHRFHSTPGVDR